MDGTVVPAEIRHFCFLHSALIGAPSVRCVHINILHCQKKAEYQKLLSVTMRQGESLLNLCITKQLLIRKQQSYIITMALGYMY